MKRSARSRKRQPTETNSQLKTIPEEMLEQQRQEHRIERTPINRQMGSSVPVSQLLSQEMSSQVDDEEAEQSERIFINQEEQRRFRALLELFRKGKITQQNAFDVPVRVLQPDEMETDNLRMWRVASDMLNVSTNIYEKRVENTYQESSKVHLGINRSEQPSEAAAKKQEPGLADRLNNLFLKGVSEIERGMLTKIDVGKDTLEDPDRLNGNPDEQFSIDPFFQKTRSTFDSSSAKGLLLNCFELAPSIEIRLLASQQKHTLDHRLTFPESFDEIDDLIDPTESKIYRIFTQTQEELCSGFQACGLEEQENTKKVVVKLEPLEISKLVEEIDEVSQLDPTSQPALPMMEAFDEPQPIDNAESAQSLPEGSIKSLNGSLNGSRMMEIISEYDTLSDKEQVIGSGRTDYLQNFHSPWDIPNAFKNKRKPKVASRDKKVSQQKKPKKQKDLIAFDYRQKIDKGFLRSKSKNRSERPLRTLKDLEKVDQDYLLPMNQLLEGNLEMTLKHPVVRKQVKMESVIPGDDEAKYEVASSDVPSTNHGQFTFAADNGEDSYPVDPINLELGLIEERDDEQEQPPRQPPAPLNLGSLLSGVPTSTQNYQNILNLQPVASQQRQISMKRYKAQLYNSIADIERSNLSSLRHQRGVSVQTTFVALLHLANEKNLAFQPTLRGDDFSITQPKKQLMEQD